MCLFSDFKIILTFNFFSCELCLTLNEGHTAHMHSLKN